MSEYADNAQIERQNERRNRGARGVWLKILACDASALAIWRLVAVSVCQGLSQQEIRHPG